MMMNATNAVWMLRNSKSLPEASPCKSEHYGLQSDTYLTLIHAKTIVFDSSNEEAVAISLSQMLANELLALV